MTVKRFEEAYNIIHPTLEKLGLTDEEIRDTLTKVFTPTAEENSEMIRTILEKINRK